ncbi:Uncharacterised protein [Yersinia rohdei]|uniref:hypothetical protein n=1 Tax=Yersinia rohdei TaxID=29485 RepID=UPI00061BF763|nr:hypothetical protein [Yersinia rohdei]CNF27925.1 Uncharacterised protein [Yersinia rohdei]
MKWVLIIILTFPVAVFSADRQNAIDFKKMTESTCFDPANQDKQKLCEKMVKLMLLRATSAGYSEAACTAKVVKDKESCEKSSMEYQNVMRYSIN